MADALRERVPDHVPEDIEIFEEDGNVYGRDDYGEFALDPMAGNPEPQDGLCNATLKLCEERYGEIRFCSRTPYWPSDDSDEEPSDYCRTHRNREPLMERAHELFEHGYFATNYINFAQKLSPTKFLFAVEMVGGLFEMSRHDFEITHEIRTIDTSETEIIEDESVDVALPMPTSDMLTFQANELWSAALKEVMTQNMQEVVFSDGVSQKTLADSADMEGNITDTKYEKTEHHLHLPISRVAKDIKEHLKNGGVSIEDDESGVVTFQKNDYTLDVSPNEDDSDDAQDVSEAAGQFHEHLQAEDDAEKIDVE